MEPRLLYSADLAGALMLAGSVQDGAEQRTLTNTGEYGASTVAASTTAAAAPTPEEVAAQTYAALALHFEVNEGQAHGSVDFQAHGAGYGIALSGGNAVLSLATSSGQQDVTLTLLGAKQGVSGQGVGLLDGRSNYILGDDRSKWHTDIANYGSVVYRDVYEGVDVRYYGTQRQLEYDFIVAPGARTDVIRVQFQGVESARIANNGDLLLRVDADTEIRFKAPVSYQRAEDGSLESVASRYKIFSDGSIGFVLGRYDHSRELVIDPVLDYATYYGDSGGEAAVGIATDAAGNVYVTGYTTSSGGAGGLDVFVVKFKGDLSGPLQYATRIGGAADDAGLSIAVDGGGNVAVAGWTKSGNFPMQNAEDNSRSGNQDAVVFKLDADGALVFSTYIGGSGDTDTGNAVGFDAAGNVYAAGRSSDMGLGILDPLLILLGTSDNAFLTKFDSGGDAVYEKFLGGLGTDSATGMAVTSGGVVYLVGSTNSGNNIATPGAAQGALSGASDGFLLRVGTTGTVQYGTYLGGNSTDAATAVAVDAATGKVYVVGTTHVDTGVTFTTTPGAFQTTTAAGARDTGFLRIYDTTVAGTGGLLYSTYIGGSGTETPTGVAFANNRVIVYGHSTSSDLTLTADAIDNTNSDQAMFLLVINPAGMGAADLQFGTYYAKDIASTGGIAVAGNHVYLAGSMTSGGAGTPDTYQPGKSGPSDALIVSIAAFANNAPVLSGAVQPPAVLEDSTGGLGFLVSSLLTGKVTDADAPQRQGIAITAASSANGTWQYSTNGGTSWSDVTGAGAVSVGSALLLAADSQTRLRFIPASNFSGTVTGALTFRAWDRTAGSATGRIDTSTHLPTSAFSDATASIDMTVTPVPDLPTTTDVSLGPVLEDSGALVITTAQLLANAGDADGTPVSMGATLTLVSGSGSLVDNGDGTWTFTPAPNFNGTATFGYTISSGGDTIVATASLVVTPVDDLPTTTDVTLGPVAEDSGAIVITTLQLLGNAADADGTPLSLSGVSITSVPGSGSLTDNGDGTWTFTPAADFNGTVTFGYSITSGADTIAGTARLVVVPVNDDFADADEAVTIAEDSATITGNVLAGSSSVDGLLTVASFQVGGTTYAAGQTVVLAGGTLTIAANGNYTFTPAADFNGSMPVVTYTVTDGSGTDDTSTLTLAVTPVNDDFADADETATVAEDSGAVTGNVLAGSTSVDGPLTVVNFQVDGTTYLAGQTVALAGGTLTIAANGNYTFTPAADFNGSIPVVTYTITDGSGTDDTSTLTLAVTPVNDGFADGDESVTVAEDSGVVTGNVLTGSSSVDGPLTVVSFQVGGTTYAAGQTVVLAGGTLTIAANGNYTFTPAADFNGAIPVVTYTVTDGSGPDDTSTLTLAVTPVNDDFTDVDEAATVAEDSGAVTGNVLAGSTSVDGPLTVVSFQVGGTAYLAGQTVALAGGTLTIAANGNYTFTPAADFNGAMPVVTYTITDGSGTDDTSTLTLAVTAVNDDFTDADEAVTVAEDSGAVTGNVLAGSTSVDGPLTVVAFQVGGTTYAAGQTVVLAGGTLTIAANGNYTFTPAGDFNGAVPVVTYTVTDGSGTDDTSTLTLAVTPVNDDFADGDESVTVAEDSGVVTGNVLTGSSSVDGPLTVVSFQVGGTTYLAGQTVALAGGTLTIAANGNYIFTPAADFNGAIPVVTYTVTDGSGTDNTSTLTLAVTAVNDDFTDADESITVAEDSGVSTGNVLSGSSSADGSLSVVSFQVGGTTYLAGQTVVLAGGTLTIAANGNYTFTPAADFHGAMPVVTYTVTDGSGTDDTSTLTLAVTPLNDDFTDGDESVNVAEDSGVVTGDVLAGSTSADGPLTVVSFQVGGTIYTAGQTVVLAGGTLTIAANGNYTFTPAADFNGSISVVRYTITDGSGTDDTSTLTLAVTPVNDDFTDADETVTVAEDSAATTGNVLSGSSSPDGALSVVSFQVGGTTYLAGQTVLLAGGTLTIAANGNYTFTPAANFNGAIPVVSYTVTDGSGTDETSTLTLAVTSVNDDFTDADETASVPEDSGASGGNVLAGSSSADGPLSVLSFQVGGTTYAAGQTVLLAGGTLTIAANGNYTFTPAADFNGSIPVVTYTVTDGSGANNTSTLTLAVNAVNDDFSDADESATVLEDSGTTTGNVLAAGNSADGALSVVSFQVGGTTYAAGQTVILAGGTLTIDSDGTYTFTPAANFNGAIPVVTYTVTDGSGTDDTSTLTLAVAPVNDNFGDGNEAATVPEDSGTSTGNVLTGSSSVDGALSVVNFQVGGTTYAVGQTVALAGGTLTIAADGTYSFTPAADFNGTLPLVTYAVTDGSGPNNISTLTLVVSPVNDDFADADESVAVPEDSGTTTGNVLAGSSSVDAALSVVSFQVGATIYAAGQTASLAGGTLTIAANGNYSFTPAANFNGTVPVVTYTVTDGSGTDDSSTLTLAVTPVNDNFGDANETGSVPEDSGTSTGNVLTGSSSVDGDLSVVSFQVGGITYAAGQTVSLAGGTLTIAADGDYSFTPAADFNGSLPLVTYTVSDGSGANNASTLTLVVTPVNDNFGDANESATVMEDSGAGMGNVLAGSSSADGPLGVVSFQVAGTTYAAGQTVVLASGTLTIAANGNYTFTPAADFNGAIPVVTYTVTDGSGANNTSTLTLAVTPLNDDFNDGDDSATVLEDSGTSSGNVLAGSSSVDGALSVVSFQVGGTTYAAGQTVALTGGTLTINANGNYSFTPAANFNGIFPVVTYTVTDGSGIDDTSTLTLAVTPVNDAPTSGTVTLPPVAEDSGSVLITAGQLLANAADVDGTALTITGVTLASGSGTLTDNGNGTWTFTPAANFNGTVAFSYNVRSGGDVIGGSATLAVTPVGDLPTSPHVTLDPVDEDSGAMIITTAQLWGMQRTPTARCSGCPG